MQEKDDEMMTQPRSAEADASGPALAREDTDGRRVSEREGERGEKGEDRKRAGRDTFAAVVLSEFGESNLNKLPASEHSIALPFLPC